MGAVMVRVFAQRYKKGKDFRFVVATDLVNNGYRVHVIDGKKALRTGVALTKEHADDKFLKLERALLNDGWERYGEPVVIEVKEPLPAIRTCWVPNSWVEKTLIPAVVFGFAPVAVRS